MSVEKRLENFLGKKLIIKIEPYALFAGVPITIKYVGRSLDNYYVCEMGARRYEFATLQDAFDKAHVLVEKYYFSIKKL